MPPTSHPQLQPATPPTSAPSSSQAAAPSAASAAPSAAGAASPYADAVQLALQRLTASGHSALGGTSDYRAPPSLPPEGAALRQEMRTTKPPSGMFQLPGQTATSHAARLVPHRAPPALPEGAATGITLVGEGRRGGVLGEKLLVAAKKHRKPPPLPPQILEQQQRSAAAFSAARPCSAAAAASSAASGSGGATPMALSAASVLGTNASGMPLTMPVHRRPPPLPTGGAVSVALHSRQHARGAAGGGAAVPAAAAPAAAAREAGGGLAAVQALKLRGPTDAHSGGWDEVDVGVEEELLTLSPQYGAPRAPQALNLPAAAWAGRHSASRCDYSPLGSPTNSSVHSSECAAPP